MMSDTGLREVTMRSLLATVGMIAAALIGVAQPLAAAGQAMDGLAGPEPIVWKLVAIETPLERTPAPEFQAYTVQFDPNGTVLVVADCNVGSGTWSADGQVLTMSAISLTRMYCGPNSIDTTYVAMLSEATIWSVIDDHLVLDLRADAGSLIFDPTITAVMWEWQQFEGSDGTVIAPDDPTRYQLLLSPDGQVSVMADCNRGIGTWTNDGPSLSFGAIATTKMGCPEGSLDSKYLWLLSQASSHVVRDGVLYIALPVDAGIMEFRARVLTDAEYQAYVAMQQAGS